mmetsp:Transcript_30957/g.100829  ORF Transcript_30957/g.100829 Transcript_30957/m.100829 type:complete len:502 (-) Transcript_30957:218-1723(-)
MLLGVRLEDGIGADHIRVHEHVVDALRVERLARDGSHGDVVLRNLHAFVCVEGGGVLLVRPCLAALFDGVRKDAARDFDDDVGRRERAFGTELCIRDETVVVDAISSNASRVDDARIRFDDVSHGCSDQSSHRRGLAPHTHARELLLALDEGERRTLELFGGCEPLVNDGGELLVWAVREWVLARGLALLWFGVNHRHELVRDGWRSAARRALGPHQINHCQIARVFASLDHQSAIVRLLEHGMVVATYDDRKDALLGHGDVLRHVLMREGDYGVEPRIRSPNLRHNRIECRHRRHNLLRVPVEGSVSVERCKLASPDVEPNQSHPPPALELQNLVPRELRLERGHVRVEPRPLKLLDALAQRRVRHVTFMVAEAHRFDWDFVQDVHHPLPMVEAREHRGSEKVTAERREQVALWEARRLTSHRRLYHWQIVQHIHVVDVEHAHAALGQVLLNLGGRGCREKLRRLLRLSLCVLRDPQPRIRHRGRFRVCPQSLIRRCLMS